jgi:hypothetical protein
VLYTLFYSGVVPQNDPLFVKLLDRILKKELLYTYPVALQAMALEAIDKVHYQNRIVQCAQFLVDNQAQNGQWGYGEKVPIENSGPPDPVVSGGGGAKSGGGGTVAVKRIPIKKRVPGPAVGDNSNTQYAALGLRACMETGVELPKAVMELADKWWEQSQNPDGSWSYSAGGTYTRKEGNTTITGGPGYGSMTAGGLGCLVIWKHYLKKDWKKNERIQNAATWLVQDRPFLLLSVRAGTGRHTRSTGVLRQARVVSGGSRVHTWRPESRRVLEFRR